MKRIIQFVSRVNQVEEDEKAYESMAMAMGLYSVTVSVVAGVDGGKAVRKIVVQPETHRYEG